MNRPVDPGGYRKDAEGIYLPSEPVSHLDDAYDASLFETVADMQERHFWYRGRDRFLRRAVEKHAARVEHAPGLAAVDLGGGCGGWARYLATHMRGRFDELALADSSYRALQLAGPVVGSAVERYQVDLGCLHWRERWDVAFLLDVIEHIEDDAAVLRQAAAALRPGGLLFVTTPALNCFWSYNDELVHHHRRYNRADFARLAGACGLELCDARYFMTLLSPLLVLSRLRGPDVSRLTAEETKSLHRRTHRVPPRFVNELLFRIFAMEAHLGHALNFGWGTSILGVFRRSA